MGYNNYLGRSLRSDIPQSGARESLHRLRGRSDASLPVGALGFSGRKNRAPEAGARQDEALSGWRQYPASVQRPLFLLRAASISCFMAFLPPNMALILAESRWRAFRPS